MSRARVPAGISNRTVHHSLTIDALTLAGLAILICAALHDFAVRTVPNLYSVMLFGLGAALRLIEGGFTFLEWGLAASCIIFALTFIFWRLGWMGGGDVKLLTGAAMFVAPIVVPLMVAGTALAGGVLALVFVAGRRLAPRPASGPRSGIISRLMKCEQWRMHKGGPLPYAAAIAVGGVIATLNS